MQNSTSCKRRAELEFKWSVPVEAGMRQFAARALACAGHAGPAGHIANLDYYFDTPAQKIAGMGMAMRLRRSSGRYELTVKSATRLENGLARRTETSVPLAARSDAAALREAAARNILRIAPSELAVLFKIHNRRTDYRIKYKTCSAVLSLDDVTIYLAQKAVRMKEIELEFSGGKLADFKRLAAVITGSAGLLPCRMSKVATARAALSVFGG
ncbi:MAG: CYTH domain-containing protein [Elusimicrobiaceae bacterium]|nr:CYTH domain-containing protein [Elusimicrobiaceae bacterium]